MIRAFRVAMAVLAFAAGVQAASAQQAAKPIALLVASGYDEMLADMDYLGELSGRQRASQQFEQLLAMVTQGRGLAGLDKTKPWGVAFFLGEARPPVVAFVPVTDLKKLLAVLEPFGGTPQESKDHKGLLKIAPLGRTVYVKRQKGWAWFSDSPQLLGKVPEDPSVWIGPLAKRYDIALEFRARNMPERYRLLAVEILRRQFKKSGARIKNPELRQLREKAFQVRMRQFEEVLQSLDRVTFGFRIDRKGRHVALELDMAFVPDSPLGRLVKDYQLVPSRLSAFSPPEAIVRVNGAVRFGDRVRRYYRQRWEQEKAVLEEAKRLAEKAPEDDRRIRRFRRALPLMERYMNFMHQALHAQAVDGAFAVENRQGRLFVSGALFLPAGPDFTALVSRGLDKLAEKAGQHVEIQRNVAQAGKVQFHRLTIKGRECDCACGKKAQALFGTQTSLVLAVERNGVCLAYGAQALEELQRRVAAMAREPRRQPEYLGYCEFALRPLLQLMQKHQPQHEFTAKLVPQLLKTLPEGDHDKIRLRTRLRPNGWRVELIFDEGVAVAGHQARQAIRSRKIRRQQREESPEF